MKKLILSTLAMMVAMTMSAITFQDQVSITLDDGAVYSHTMSVGESNDLNAGLNSGYYAEIQNLNEMPVAIYALYNGVKYSNIASKSFSNLPICIKTNDVTTYTLYFDDVEGSVNLYDKKLNAPVTVTEGGDYEFTIEESEKNSLINDRFYLNYDATQMGYTVNLNSYGMATFSAAERTVVPAGLKAYAAGNLSGTELTLTEVASEGDYIPANTGVLLYGEQSGNPYTMTINAGDAAAFAGNKFHAATEWTASLENVYILHGNELWQYTGTEFAPN